MRHWEKIKIQKGRMRNTVVQDGTISSNELWIHLTLWMWKSIVLRAWSHVLDPSLEPHLRSLLNVKRMGIHPPRKSLPLDQTCPETQSLGIILSTRVVRDTVKLTVKNIKPHWDAIMLVQYPRWMYWVLKEYNLLMDRRHWDITPSYTCLSFTKVVIYIPRCGWSIKSEFTPSPIHL